MARTFDICDAVVADLITAGYTEAQFLAMPLFEARDMDTRHVTVTPGSPSYDDITRAAQMATFPVDIAVQQRITTDNSAQVETLVGVCEAIATTMHKRRLTTRTTARVIATEHMPLYDVESLRERKLFVGVVRITIEEQI